MRFLWSIELSHRSSEFAANSNNYTHKHWEESFQGFPLDTPQTVLSHTNLTPTNPHIQGYNDPSTTGWCSGGPQLCEWRWPHFPHHWCLNLTEMWQTPPHPGRGRVTQSAFWRSQGAGKKQFTGFLSSSTAPVPDRTITSGWTHKEEQELISSTSSYSCSFSESI